MVEKKETTQGSKQQEECEVRCDSQQPNSLNLGISQILQKGQLDVVPQKTLNVATPVQQKTMDIQALLQMVRKKQQEDYII